MSTRNIILKNQFFQKDPQKVAASIVIALVFLMQIFLSQLSVERILEYSVNDDTFYYLEVAFRAARGEGFTFDGINPTNGFQPAWGFLLSAVALLISNKVIFLRAAIIVASLFNLAAGFLIFQISNSILTKKVVLYPLLFWASVQLSPSLSLTALENSMNWAFFALTIWYLVKIAQKKVVIEKVKSLKFIRNIFAFGFLCALLFLIRVDNLFFVFTAMLLASYLFAKTTKNGNFHTRFLLILFSIGFVALLFVLPYLLWNLFNHGGLLPISGEIKQKYNYIHVIQHMGGYYSFETFEYSLKRLLTELLWTISNNLRVFRGGEAFWLTNNKQFILISIGIFAVLFTISAIKNRLYSSNFASMGSSFKKSIYNWALIMTFFWLFYGGLNFIPFSAVKVVLKLLLIAGILITGGLILRYEKLDLENQFSLSVSQKLVLFFTVPLLIHLFILIYTVDYFLHYTHWYYANYFIIFSIGLGILVEFVYFSLEKISQDAQKVVSGFLAAWLFLGFVFSTINYFEKITAPLSEPPIGINGMYQTAKWIDENLPEDIVVASYNAGVIGYFSNRSTINLDGLINNRELVPYLFGSKSMTNYIDYVCPDYLADYVKLDIDPQEYFSHFEENDKFMGINNLRLRPLYWNKSLGWFGETRTHVVLEINKEYCSSVK